MSCPKGRKSIIENFSLQNVSIHRNFYQKWLIKECARKCLLKSRSHMVVIIFLKSAYTLYIQSGPPILRI